MLATAALSRRASNTAAPGKPSATAECATWGLCPPPASNACPARSAETAAPLRARPRAWQLVRAPGETATPCAHTHNPPAGQPEKRAGKWSILPAAAEPRQDELGHQWVDLKEQKCSEKNGGRKNVPHSRGEF